MIEAEMNKAKFLADTSDECDDTTTSPSDDFNSVGGPIVHFLASTPHPVYGSCDWMSFWDQSFFHSHAVKLAQTTAEVPSNDVVQTILCRKCTTVMTRDFFARRRITAAHILKVLKDMGFLETCDYLYMPQEEKRKGNTRTARSMGYCFINFISPEVAAEFARSVVTLGVGGSTKSCRVVVAAVQGVRPNLLSVSALARPYVRIGGELVELSAAEALEVLAAQTDGHPLEVPLRHLSQKQLGPIGSAATSR